MTINKRKKNSRQRGHNSHGWGAKKKHRGAGNRGGRGNAGTGKRGDAKKPSIWKERYFGKLGFKKKGQKTIIHIINVSSIDQKTEKLLSNKLIEKKQDHYIIDLEKLGFNKLLGSGKVTKKLKITTPFASKKVIESVKAAGGEVILTQETVENTPSTKAD